MATTSKIKKTPTKKLAKSQPPEQLRPFLEHLKELRSRLFAGAVSVIIGATVAYVFHKQLTDFLLRPAGGQQFIFTSPGGGIDFLLRLCIYSGLIASVSIITFQVLKFLQPIIKHDANRFVRMSCLASAVLALVGSSFGYFVGLPAAMNFLLNSFSSPEIQALITIQSYLNFVAVYLLGCALLFQVPLVLLVINRVKPLKPSRLFLGQRWFILGAFVLGAIINPSPNIQDQLLLAIPMIVMYQLSIGLIWLVNRRPRKQRQLNPEAELA